MAVATPTNIQARIDKRLATIFTDTTDAEALEKLLEQYIEMVKPFLENSENKPALDMTKMHFAGFQADAIFERIIQAIRGPHGIEVWMTILPALIASIRRGNNKSI